MKRRAQPSAPGPHSVLLFARFSYAHVGPGRDDFERIDNSSDIAQHAVGEITCITAGAPGVGRWTYRIAGINAMGVWAEEISCTVRELSPAEVV